MNEHIHEMKVTNMKTYTFIRDNSALVPSTPAVRSFVKSMYLMTKSNITHFSGEDVMKYAYEHNLWETKQDPSKWMTTWAFYVKTLKTCGLKEVGNTSSGRKSYATMNELFGEEEKSEEE